MVRRPVARTSPPRFRRLLIAFALAILLTPVWLIPFYGRLLVVEDPLEKVDAIFVLAGSRADRWLETIDLFRDGYAPRIVLSSGRMDAAEYMLLERGIRLATEAEIARDAMVQLGVPASAIRVTTRRPDNTADEGFLLRRMVTAEKWRAVLIVTSKYHTRRARFAIHRELKDSDVRVLVRGSRYDRYDPAYWWRRRSNIRFTLEEWSKLIIYHFGLGA